MLHLHSVRASPGGAQPSPRLQAASAGSENGPGERACTGCSSSSLGRGTSAAETDASDSRARRQEPLRPISNSLCSDSILAFNCASAVHAAFVQQDNELIGQCQGFSPLDIISSS